MVVCLEIWLFAVMGGFTAKSQDAAWAWFRLSVVGFTFLHSATLHFAMTFTGALPRREILSWWVYSLSAPFCLYGVLGPAGSFVFRSFEREGDHWIGIVALDSPVFILFVLQYVAYYVVTLLLLALWKRKERNPRQKAQAALVFASILVSEVLFNFEPFVLPLLTGYRTPLIAPVFGFFWAAGIGLAMKYFGLLEWKPDKVSVAIVEGSEECIVFFNAEGKPVLVNKTARLALGISPSSDPGSLEDIVENAGAMRTELARLGKGSDSFSCSLRFRGEDRRLREARWSAIDDSDGRRLGILLMARPAKSAASLAERSGLSQRELEMAALVVAGRSTRNIAGDLGIAERTVKAHLTSIYTKLGVRSRMGLVAALRGWNLLPETSDAPPAFPLLGKRSDTIR